MKTRTSIFSLLLLTAVSGAVAQSLPKDLQALSARPLNLSVRQPGAPVTNPALIVAEPMPGTTSNEEAGVPANLPYGAGFESRQQGNTTGSGNAGSTSGSSSAGGSGNAGSGGGGRGGAGRGR